MSRLKRSTLTDVARAAGVSVTTASYILNGRSAQMRISAETEERVREAMRELDYRPNWSARTLRRSTTQTIGFVSDFVAGGGVAGQLVNGANAAARTARHLLVIGESLGDAEVEELLLEEMVARQVDGTVYATLFARMVTAPAVLRGQRAVLLNCQDPDSGLPAVLPDDRRAGCDVGQHLVASGVAGRVLVVGDDELPDATAGRERVAGLAEALARAGAAPAEVLACPWEVGRARETLASWWAEGRRATALVCLNDRIAMGAYQALAEAGVHVPDDVSVISFDGSELATWLRPQLTSMALPLRAMGEAAVETVLDSSWRSAGTRRLPLELQPGSSVAGSSLATLA